MKALLATVIVLLGLFGCANTGEIKQAQRENIAWLDMCQLLVDESAGYHCARLLPPLVEYEPMRDGLQGYYDGSDTIYISTSLDGVTLQEVLMHEGIHYVHVQLQMIPVPGPADAICWSENEAWTLTGIFFGEDNSRWWRAYPHCWEFYADSQELYEWGVIWNIINEIIEGIIFETPGE